MQFPADLITFTEEILNGILHFFCSEIYFGAVSNTRYKDNGYILAATSQSRQIVCSYMISGNMIILLL